MIRIRKKNKTSRRKLTTTPTTPKSGKPVPEKAAPKAAPKMERGNKRGGGGGSHSYAKKGQWTKSRSAPSGKPREPEVKEELVFEKGEFTLPGAFVGTSEEFRAGEGTAVISGDIYSTATGYVATDKKARVIAVLPSTSTPNFIKDGDIVYGRISNVRESGAAVEIAGIEGRYDRAIVNLSLGDIHVSNVRDSYVKRLDNELAVGDLVRAKVVDVGKMRLSTNGDTLGVMKAYCSNCKGELVQEGKKLKCPHCNRIETRKISSDYGTGIN